MATYTRITFLRASFDLNFSGATQEWSNIIYFHTIINGVFDPYSFIVLLNQLSILQFRI